MTAEDFADLIHADKVGRNMWEANCPAHDDHNHSLSISPGHRRGAYVVCMKKCSIYRIVERLGIEWDEFTSFPLPQPNFDDMPDSEVDSYQNAERQRQAKHRAACEDLRAQDQILNRLRGKLKAIPDEDRPQELIRKLKDARLLLRTLQEKEGRLRAPGTCPEIPDERNDRLMSAVDVDAYIKRVTRARERFQESERRAELRRIFGAHPPK